MAKKYPLVGRKEKPKNAGGLPCIICASTTTGKVDIEINYFRGDDEQVRVCDICQNSHDDKILEAYTRASQNTPNKGKL